MTRSSERSGKLRMTKRGEDHIFTDIRLSIDKAYFNPERLKKILRRYNVEVVGSHYRVEGSYLELVELVNTLQGSSGPTGGATYPRGDPHSSQGQPVQVSPVVMDYILQKCGDELRTIQGDSVVIENQPDLRAGHNKSGGTVSVTFRWRRDSPYPADGSHCVLVRQRFITFYQRTASDLQTVSVHLSSQDQAALQHRFPRLLFMSSANQQEVTVMGPFGYVARLQQLVSQWPQSSAPRSGGGALAVSRRGRTSASPHSKDPKDETCAICMDKIVAADKETLRCNHSFCKDCLKTAFAYKPVCPTCGQVYGVLKGTQPAGGTMTLSKSPAGLPGYEGYATIVIHYNIPNGIQKDEHPSPGQPYDGVSRRAYLPDCAEGRAVLGLLQRAFDQRLIFTIGRSSTSGRNNVITWNDVHHKTSTHGGPTNYGYPDPNYLRRVRDELKVKGIE